ncbi:MAG: lipase maturation factor family protein [Isosphaeraceae bacterium]
MSMPSDENRSPGAASLRRTRSLLLRGVGLCYASAFGSLAVQVEGLIGSRGMLPAREFLDHARQALGPSAYRELPTVFWLDASDASLLAVAWGGAAAGALVVAGVSPKPLLALLWAGYLSLAVAGQEFLGYQWDMLLLEAGFLSVLTAPWGLWLPAARGEPSRVAVFLFRWLLFRLMFLSGVVKLRSGDPTWWALDALKYHYETQPIPAWTSWYAHNAPAWFHRLSAGFMFIVELPVPFLMFGTRWMRRAAFFLTAGLQLGILATGNYGFFNVLTLVLCVALLDDRDLAWLRLGREETPQPPAPGHWGRRVLLAGLAAVLIGVSGHQTLEAVAPRVPTFWPLELARETLAPFRSLNTYGLFAVMTTERPEITVEGSNDGETWLPYRFRWKAGEPGRPPRFATPHLPRLDWQMWFAALSGDCRGEPWFLQFEQRLLEGSPPVLALLRENPFPNTPPRLIRARISSYRFTRPPTRDWWSIEGNTSFCPPIELRNAGPAAP